MYVFQVIAFVLEIIFGLVLGGIIALYPQIFSKDKTNDIKSYRHGDYTSNMSKRKYKRYKKKFGRSIWFVIVLIITIYFLKPYFLDIPRLVKGDFKRITSTAYKVTSKSKDPYEYITMGGANIKFFFSSGIEEYNEYEVGYLPNTSRGIYAIKLDDNNISQESKIDFPFKEIAIFILFAGILILLDVMSPYLKFKLFALSCIIFYPTFIYSFIKHGLKYGIWISRSNQIFVTLCVVSPLSLSIGFLYLYEKYRNSKTMLYVQICAILNFLMVIALFIAPGFYGI